MQRKRNRRRLKERRPVASQKGKTKTADSGRFSSKENPTGQKKPQSENSKFKWIKIEHRDSAGNLTIPKNLIQGTNIRRYSEVPEDSEIKAYVLAGYKPMPFLLVERKIYEIHRLFVHGWRRQGQIVIELEDWRYHEVDWFMAMRGAPLSISDPGQPGIRNEDSEYLISETSFDQKIVNHLDENSAMTEVRMYEGTLDIKEKWKSACRRQAAEIVNMGFKLLVVPFSVALGASLTLLWLGGSQGTGKENPPLIETTTELENQSTDGNSSAIQPNHGTATNALDNSEVHTPVSSEGFDSTTQNSSTHPESSGVDIE